MRGLVSVSLTASLATLAISLAPAIAGAHVSVSSPAYANTTQEITFGVGHGCEGSDTSSVRVEIPAGVTSVRAINSSDFGKATVEKDATGNVTAVVWQKSLEDVLPSDTNYYKLSIRAKLPNAPFTTLYFPTHQTCRSGDGGVLSTDWVGTPATATDAGTDEPAPALVVLPARRTGWNKVAVPIALSSLSPYFDDAQIVWKGTAAHSANPATLDQIKSTAGVTVLTALAAGDEIWVKY